MIDETGSDKKSWSFDQGGGRRRISRLMGGADKRCSSRVTGCASICSSFNVSVESERSSSLSDAGGVELSGDGSRGVCSVICSLSLATTELSDALLLGYLYRKQEELCYLVTFRKEYVW